MTSVFCGYTQTAVSLWECASTLFFFFFFFKGTLGRLSVVGLRKHLFLVGALDVCLYWVFAKTNFGPQPQLCITGFGPQPQLCITGSDAQPQLCITGSGLQPQWCITEFGPQPQLCITGFGPQPRLCVKGFGPQPQLCITGFGPQPQLCITGSGPQPQLCIIGSGPQPQLCIIGSGQVLYWKIASAVYQTVQPSLVLVKCCFLRHGGESRCRRFLVLGISFCNKINVFMLEAALSYTVNTARGFLRAILPVREQFSDFSQVARDTWQV